MTESTLLQQSRLVVRWGDMDALGHVNNTVYFRYCEQARIEWLEHTGIAASVASGAATGPVVANAYCEFRRAIVYPAAIEVRMLAGPPGRSSFETLYEIRDAADATILYATGSARVVWVDHTAGRATPLPEIVRALLPEPV